jgi:hypothetical protein
MGKNPRISPLSLSVLWLSSRRDLLLPLPLQVSSHNQPQNDRGPIHRKPHRDGWDVKSLRASSCFCGCLFALNPPPLPVILSAAKNPRILLGSGDTLMDPPAISPKQSYSPSTPQSQLYPFPTSVLLFSCGFTVLRITINRFSVSNQNGAPNEIARAVITHPASSVRALKIASFGAT